MDSEKVQGSKPSPGEQPPPHSWSPGLRLGEQDSAKKHMEVLEGKVCSIHTGREVVYISALKMVPNPPASGTVLSRHQQS